MSCLILLLIVRNIVITIVVVGYNSSIAVAYEITIRIIVAIDDAIDGISNNTMSIIVGSIVATNM